MAYDAFVFDFFGVVCSEIAPFWFRKYLPEREAAEVKNRLVGPADSGIISQEELFVRLGEFAGIPPKQVQDEWWTYVSINEEVIEIVRDLRKDHKVALLTNAISGFFGDIMTRYELGGLFDPVVISSEERVAKPDPLIYRRVLGKLSVSPDKAIMIDDNPANIKGARAVGMNGVVFESAGQLREMLVRSGHLKKW